VSSTDLVQLLLARGVDVNAQLTLFPPYRSLADRGNDNMLTIGATPLLRAAKAGDVDVVRWLLEKGADATVATIEGNTPLLTAAGVASRDSDTRGRFRTEAQAIATVELLLAAGADINEANGAGMTALHGAAFWGWNGLVQLLVDRGARIDVKDARGRTPIDAAMGRAGGNGFGGNRIDVHADTAALLEKLAAAQ
jgi:ankyrin repeat protein